MKQHTHLAFSVHELLTAIALIGISASITLPALASLKQKSEQEALRHALHASLHNARMQAILHRRSVELCATSDGAGCNNKWQDGWQSYFLNDPHHSIEIHQHRLASPLYWAGFTKTIRFHANGTSPISNGRFFQCRNGSVVWQLIINRQGRIRVGTTAENHGQAYRCPG